METPEADTGPDFSFLPEQFNADGTPDTAAFRSHYDELVAADAMRQEAMADVPKDGSGYEFTLPEDIDFGDLPLPDDYAVALKTDDPAMKPLLDEFGAALHKYNLPKSAATDMLGVLAKYQAAEFSKFYAEEQADIQSMGNSFQSRAANVTRALKTKLGADDAETIGILASSAKGVRALEKLLQPRGMNTGNPTPTPPRTVQDDLEAYYSNPSSK